MTNLLELQQFYKVFNKSMEPMHQEIGHFNIFKVEDLLLPDNKPNYSRRNFFKVSLVTGHSKIHYADKCMEVQDTALVFTNPMIPYNWERISEKHSGYVCIFTEDFFSRFGPLKDYPVFQFTDTAVVPLSPQQLPPYQELFDKMWNELQGDYQYKYDLLRNLLMEVIHGAQKMQPAASHPQTGSNAAERITAIFAELLERQFPIELSNQVLQLSTPAAFARQLNVHVNHLNKALRETTGQTTSKLISDRILQEARILLKSTNWTVNEIAWSLGFKEPNHFSSFFKNMAGATPKQFRQTAID
ncbi:helix-turn-helix transcriptional regulator [Chitinophaga agrisoli]|uniref:Helix-turn-helix transcriptional regulator n=1 Tax=Chitinophaga agrisoli TaxID=2607653 RepID=A0A5B2VMQ0_9BACT|nr:AraC family transcriptional regulator [Chitinophaga agrisoli]KAA2239572.1 helix-turn-helix transcriptional regulator [Chitinophaga agrisoli]